MDHSDIALSLYEVCLTCKPIAQTLLQGLGKNCKELLALFSSPGLAMLRHVMSCHVSLSGFGVFCFFACFFWGGIDWLLLRVGFSHEAPLNLPVCLLRRSVRTDQLIFSYMPLFFFLFSFSCRERQQGESHRAAEFDERDHGFASSSAVRAE
jgi:hypothetical protein